MASTEKKKCRLNVHFICLEMHIFSAFLYFFNNSPYETSLSFLNVKILPSSRKIISNTRDMGLGSDVKQLLWD